MSLPFMARFSAAATLAALLVLAPALGQDAPPPAASAPAPQDQAGPAPGGEIPVLSFTSPGVDGVDELVLRGETASIDHKRWEPIADPKFVVHRAFPRDGSWKAAVRNLQGRSKVQVIAEPTPLNEFELRVLIDDEKLRGAAPLSFDVVAVPSRSAPRPYNVVIITLDTCRADKLGCYGYGRPTTPNLDRFARQSVVYRDAWSTSSFTPPAHASIFTGQYVSTHGLLAWKPGLPDAALTLAEIFKQAGYRTVASVNLSLLSVLNLGQGFDERTERKADHGHDLREARVIVNDGLDALRGSSKKPLFLWLHFYDIHAPYARHPNWARRFNPEGRPGVGDLNEHYNRFPAQVEKLGFSQADLQFICDRYDAGVAYVDAQLGPLLDELSTPQRLADTLVVITSDHGENLLEHRERIFTHDPYLFGVVTQVPLIIRYPDARNGGTMPDAQVSLIDVAPTVLDVVGLAHPAGIEGLSLVPMLSGAPWTRTEVFMEAFGWQQQVKKAARSKNVLVYMDQKASKTAFYDLRTDAGEQQPLAQPPDAAAADLLKKLQTFIARAPLPPRTAEPDEIAPDFRKQLQGLGYIDADASDDTGRSRGAGESGGGDDPPQKKLVNPRKAASQPSSSAARPGAGASPGSGGG